jgi:hypothetical protein
MTNSQGQATGPVAARWSPSASPTAGSRRALLPDTDDEKAAAEELQRMLERRVRPMDEQAARNERPLAFLASLET